MEPPPLEAVPVPKPSPFEVPAKKVAFEAYLTPKTEKPKITGPVIERQKGIDPLECLSCIQAALKLGDILPFTPDRPIGESEVKATYPSGCVVDVLDKEEPMRLLGRLCKDLVKGDTIGFALFETTLYYWPRMKGNIYDDQLATKEREDLAKKTQNKDLKKRGKTGNTEQRMANMERYLKLQHDKDKQIETLQTSTKRLIDMREASEVDMDRIEAMDTKLANTMRTVEILRQQMLALEAHLRTKLAVKEPAPIV